jgi:phosphoglycerate kinase
MKANRVVDDFRIRASIPTIQFIKKHGGIPIVLTHLEPVKSVKPVMEHAMKLAKFRFEYLENLRFQDGEEANDAKYARALAKFGDVYVNDAFSVAHRAHASVVRLPKLLPAYMGLSFAHELAMLSSIRHPKRPFVFILGGIKFDTKVGVLSHYMKHADTIFIGGGLANTFLAATGTAVGASHIEKEATAHIKKKYLHSPVLLPTDVVVTGHKTVFVGDIPASAAVLDIGAGSIAALAPLLKRAHTVLWNGPLGHTEKGYTAGSKRLIALLSRIKGTVVIGGGDTHVLIRSTLKRIPSHMRISTGGGAMLVYLGTGTLPGLQALARKKS